MTLRHFRYLFYSLLITCSVSCQTSSNSKKGDSFVKSQKPQSLNIVEGCKSISGDFDGDGAQEIIGEHLVHSRDGRYLPCLNYAGYYEQYHEGGSIDHLGDSIYFNDLKFNLISDNPNIPSHDLDEIGHMYHFHNEGDLNGDGRDYISKVSSGGQSSLIYLSLFTYLEDGWKYINHTEIHYSGYKYDNKDIEELVRKNKNGDIEMLDVKTDDGSLRTIYTVVKKW